MKLFLAGLLAVTTIQTFFSMLRQRSLARGLLYGSITVVLGILTWRYGDWFHR